MTGEGFKHITVTAADDDEVIVAGVRGADERQPAAAPSPDPAPPAAAPSPDPAPLAAAEPLPAPASAPGPEPAPDRGRPGDGYRETTLEDLESQPMPFMQRAVIVAAVVCIIGALVYYFVAMG